MRLNPGDRRLHDFSTLENKRQLHLPGTEQFADFPHGIQQMQIDDVQGRDGRERFVNQALQAAFTAIDKLLAETILQGEIGFHFHFSRNGLAGKGIGENRQWIVGLSAVGQHHGARRRSVIDQIKGHLPMLIFNSGAGQNFGRVHDGTGQPCQLQFVQEDTVEHHSSGGLQSERDVRQSTRDLCLGECFSNSSDPFDGLQPRPAILGHPGRDGQHQWIKEQVLGMESMNLGGTLVHPCCDFQFSVRSSSHGLFGIVINAAQDNGRTMLAGQLAQLIKFRLPLFEVGTVDNGPAPARFQARADGLDLG